MQFAHNYTIALPREQLWPILMDVHKVAECMTGVESLDVISDDNYEGVLAVKMGPVRLRFNGVVNVTRRDDESWIGVLEATARDAKAGGGFRASLTMQLLEPETGTSALDIDLETTFLGRIGELGRPLIKKKINTMMDDFIAALNEAHVTPGATP